MRIKQILVAFLFTALVISCGNKAKDIDVSEIKTECEVLDAMVIVANEIIALGEAVDSEEGASEEQKKEFKSLMEKVKEIENQGNKSDFSKKAFEKCPNYETVGGNREKVRKARKKLQKAMK
jgi:hypothetical protein